MERFSRSVACAALVSTRASDRSHNRVLRARLAGGCILSSSRRSVNGRLRCEAQRRTARGSGRFDAVCRVIARVIHLAGRDGARYSRFCRPVRPQHLSWCSKCADAQRRRRLLCELARIQPDGADDYGALQQPVACAALVSIRAADRSHNRALRAHLAGGCILPSSRRSVDGRLHCEARRRTARGSGRFNAICRVVGRVIHLAGRDGARYSRCCRPMRP